MSSLIMKDNHYFVQINQDIREICEPFFKQHGIIYFAYIRHFDDGSCIPHLSLIKS